MLPADPTTEGCEGGGGHRNAPVCTRRFHSRQWGDAMEFLRVLFEDNGEPALGCGNIRISSRSNTDPTPKAVELNGEDGSSTIALFLFFSWATLVLFTDSVTPATLALTSSSLTSSYEATQIVTMYHQSLMLTLEVQIVT